MTDELAELLWDHGPALRRAPAPPPPLFQPFTCSAAGSSRSHELKRHAVAADATTTKAAATFVTPVQLGAGLGGLPVHDDDDDDAVPWLHFPVGVDDGGDADTAPLPPEYCASLLSDYSGEVAAPAAVVPAAPPEPAAAANKLAPPSAAAAAGGGGGGGEGVVNFTFFSRPLQRPQAASAAAASNPVESTVVQAATNRLRSTPLFSEQRMAWLQPPKAPRAAAAAATPAPPPPPPPPLLAPLLPDSRHGETVGTVAQPRSQPEARPPDAAAVTTSSVCSGNGDRSQLKRSSHTAADCSISPDEDLDDELGATRSAARSSKRSRTAEVHNLSERRRRDRINEKMRALQELIPNCNKIDKASMLEEAIEYLKTLQLQVQMMSMGTGLCMPPAMLLPAMHHQHMQALHHHHSMAHAHFPHLGMGLGFGMGMGAAAAAAGFDMLPRVAAAGAHHFPCTPMAMPSPGAMFGVVPGQGMPTLPAAFAHMAGAGVGSGAAPAGQMEAAAAAAAAPSRPGEAEQGPPVRGVAQGDQEAQQHPKHT